MSPLFTLRRAWRGLAQHRSVTFLAVLALALGVGLSTAMFSFVDAAVRRGLPIAQGDRLMHLERRKLGARGEGFGTAARDYVTWRTQQKSFETLGAYRSGTVTMRVDQSVDQVAAAAYLTPEAVDVVGAQAMQGRVFTSTDTRAEAQAPVLLSDHIWRDRFSRDASVVGQTISIDGAAHTVLGIMPPDFRFPLEADLWLPFVVPATAADDTTFPQFDVIGKLRTGVSVETARGEFAVIAKRVAQDYPSTNTGIEVTVKPFTERYLGESATSTMYVMLAAVLLVLIIACANVANLLLVRAIHRSRDVAIAMAIGATRQHIAVQILTESALIAGLGAGLGLLVARGCMALMGPLFAERMPYWAEPRLDLTVLLFALVMAAASAMLAGIIPALKTTKTDLSKTLSDASRGATGVRAGRVMRGLVIVELALSMGLLVSTALLTVSARNSANVDLGFTTSSLFTARVSLPDSYAATARARFYDELERSVQGNGAVSAVGLISDMPGTHAAFRRIAIEGVVYDDKNEAPSTRYAAASAQFFPALQVQPISGRVFGPQDREDTEQVVVVNAQFVRRFFPNANPVGKRIRVGAGENSPWRTIVGVVPNLWMGAFDSSPERNPSGVYVPLAQTATQTVSLVVQARGAAPLSVTDAVRTAAFALDHEVPIYQVQDIPQLVASGTWFYGLGAGILGACGATALVLAFVGVYGVIAFSVQSRRREFGVRMALGADAPSIVRLVVGRGLSQVVAGLTVGSAIALLISKGISSLLFGISPAEPLAFGGVGVALASVAAIAMLIPALSAARTEPLEALRGD